MQIRSAFKGPRHRYKLVVHASGFQKGTRRRKNCGHKAPQNKNEQPKRLVHAFKTHTILELTATETRCTPRYCPRGTYTPGNPPRPRPPTKKTCAPHSCENMQTRNTLVVHASLDQRDTRENCGHMYAKTKTKNQGDYGVFKTHTLHEITVSETNIT